jgi:hypothetical protein
MFNCTESSRKAVVPKEGLEPSRCFHQRILKEAPLIIELQEGNMTDGGNAGRSTKVQEGPAPMRGLGQQIAPERAQARAYSSTVPLPSRDAATTGPNPRTAVPGAKRSSRSSLVALLANAIVAAVTEGDAEAARILNDAIGCLLGKP